jgi:hypothetical protein
MAAPLDRAEVKKRVKSALGIMITDTELDIHPPMRPDHNTVDLVRHFFICDFVVSFDFCHMPHCAIFEQGQLCMVHVLDSPLLDPAIR